jgi:YYY domain-containing protein
MRDILAWALATEIVGLAVLPLLRFFFNNRRDAALLSRPVGLALVAWLGWALSLVTSLGFRRGTLMLAVAIVGAGAWLARRRAPSEHPAAGPVWGDEESLAAALFWGAAAVFIVIRAAGPAILSAEKFMDLAFLNSLARYPNMPPHDPWMSGHSINYYYWGYLLAAAQTKLSGVRPMVAYNLAVASFGGFSFVAAACLGLRLARGRLGTGIAAAAATVFAGNLAGAFGAWAAPFAVDFDYWAASRVIGPENFKTINEFPFFTFFHADLHPHLLAFPYFVASFALAHRWLERGVGKGTGRWSWLPLVALVAGTARAASLWNMPALAILLVVSGVFAPTRGQRLPRPGTAVGGLLAGLGAFLVSLLLFYPYTASFQLENRGLGRATMFSPLPQFLGVWGILVAVCLVGLWPYLRGDADDEAGRRRRDLGLVAAAAVSLVVGLASGRPALIVLLFLAMLAARAAWRSLHDPDGDASGVFAAFLVLLALAMIGGCEFVYFKDSYGADLQRMNTIFKFYHQAWPLLAIGSVVWAGRAWEEKRPARRAARAVLVAAAFVAALWPVNVVVSRLRQREGPFTLDAAVPLARRDPGDAAAIAWLAKNAPVGSVVLEATGDPYSEFARISTHTGIPTVMGWANHEGLWRSNDKEVDARAAAVRSFYDSPDPRTAWAILGKYRVTHVVLGDLERKAYPKAAIVGDLPYLVPVFTSGHTTVYAVAPPS